MAKGRVINKSISTSNKVNLGLRNPLDCLLYTWGLCHADDEGRIDGHATIYRATVAPALPGLTDSRVDISLTAMETAHLITRYTVQGVMTIQFLDWDVHQTFKGFKRKPSHFPPEPKEVKITQPGDNHPTLPVKELKVKESKEDILSGKTSPDEIPFSEIIEYLNLKTRKNFKCSTPKTRDFIRLRLNEGFSLQSFKSVIDIKSAEWKDDLKYCKYLRPETLFGTNFESYLNQKSNGVKNGTDEDDDEIM